MIDKELLRKLLKPYTDRIDSGEIYAQPEKECGWRHIIGNNGEMWLNQSEIASIVFERGRSLL